MNERHNDLSIWGIRKVNFDNAASVLDIGCGGGKNIANLTNIATNAKVFGVDYSPFSVATSKKHNKKSVKLGKVEVTVGSAENLPYEDNAFDVITAFETVYFWDIEKAFVEVLRVLKSCGEFLIVNEAVNKEGLEELIEKIGFNVYSGEELENALKKAGFVSVELIRHENNKWIAVIAKK